eukprot:scaffold50704_cov22-Cyclotella_meneghiniana.AAC.3
MRGDPATLVYDGFESLSTLTFEALDLTPDLGYDLGYAFNVLLVMESSTAARSSARGIVGWIREEQIMTFLSNDCDVDKLVLSFEFSEGTNNLCGATEHCHKIDTQLLVK